MPILWRISNHASLSGEGGLRYSARWHTAGLPVVYLAASPAGAMIEILVHLELSEDSVPLHYHLLEIAVPHDLVIEELQPQSRPHQAEWKLDLSYTRSLGDAWLRGRTAAIAKVPSAILPDTWNYLLNPLHPRMSECTIVKSTSALYDPRLMPKLKVK